ncbi:MAG TPA: PGPGW domain-containing protein [Polyangiales bacterium]|nr:PGPGW domain-containing protein [Polyangiales bacterium]
MNALDWLKHPVLVAIAVPASIAILVLGLVLAPWLLARVPEDYFVREPRPSQPDASVGHKALVALRAVAGGLLILLGIAMLVLPGQGVLTMMAGLALLPFPGKRALELKLMRNRSVRKLVTAIRRKAGKPPLRLEAH